MMSFVLFFIKLIDLINLDIALSYFVIKYFMDKSIKTYLKTAAKDYSSRSVNPPVVRASTILFKTMQELKKASKRYSKRKRC